jgi:hypothetical protein
MTSYLFAERNSLPRDIGYGINKSSNGRGSVAADSVVAYRSKENKSEDAPARLRWSAVMMQAKSRFFDSAVPFDFAQGPAAL